MTLNNWKKWKEPKYCPVHTAAMISCFPPMGSFTRPLRPGPNLLLVSSVWFLNRATSGVEAIPSLMHPLCHEVRKQLSGKLGTINMWSCKLALSSVIVWFVQQLWDQTTNRFHLWLTNSQRCSGLSDHFIELFYEPLASAQPKAIVLILPFAQVKQNTCICKAIKVTFMKSIKNK